jgi:predicted DNA-binding transcriptional regulator YafY
MEPALAAPKRYPNEADKIDMARLRTAIRAQGKIALLYRDENGQESRRVIWPIAVAYWETVRLIVGWCELRNAFRHFRTDRVLESEFLEARYPLPRARLRLQWKKEMESSDRRAPQKGAARSNSVPVE